MKPQSLRVALASIATIFPALALLPAAHAQPLTVNGDPFTLVATGPGTQLFGLASDDAGRVYAGNNSNTTTGIPVQRFDPALFSGVPVALQNFGPAVGDADGLAILAGHIYVADRDEGVRSIAISDESHFVHIAAVAINETGSPLVIRPSDGHLFVGLGGVTGILRIDEYDAAGAFVRSITTVTDVETMTFDPGSGLIYYAPFGAAVRSLDPATGEDLLVGMSSGTIDGGLAFDPITGLLFVGTANGVNSGLVETIDPGTGQTSLFASGFNGSLGILREPVSGDLYFLESNQLYRLPSQDVDLCPTPGSPCRTAQSSGLTIKKGKTSAKDKLVWKWSRGQSVSFEELSDPRQDGYTLCLYTGDTFRAQLLLPDEPARWKVLAGKGYKYKDKSGTPDGVTGATLKASDADKSKAKVKGKGENLPDLDLGEVETPIIVRLVGGSSNVCLESSFGPEDVIRNTNTQIKAKDKVR
ncbi:MAG TPA: hypothetical protein VEL28_06875 [Candidatus Binatia bacterium]|nr:hypothetical protein [Candidatus Binatia bacterium]